jgi:hypothetical protein
MRIFGRIVVSLMIASVLFFTVQSAHAQNDAQIAALEQRLKEQFVVAQIAPSGDILTAGSIIVLQKEGLWMCGLNAGGALENTYKSGKLSAGRFGWGLALGLMKIDTNTIPQLKFKTGDKFWVKSYKVDKGGIHFFFWSDAIEDVRYYGWLKIPFAKGAIPSPDDAMKMISEVVIAEPMDNQAQGVPAPEPPPPNEPSAVIAPLPPPPPPPDAPPAAPKTITRGQTKDQVTAILGQPLKKATMGAKEIYYYSDMKVILVNGKVTDAQ